jgi:uncharacterized protein YggE
MKKGLLLVIGLVLVISLLLIGCETQETTGANGSQQTGVWVSGTGKVTAVPDVAIFSLGVEAQEKTVKEAQSEAISAMNAIITALKANGVAEKDIQTQWYNISPVMKWVEDTNEQITIGYKVTNMATVKIRDISKAGATIDAVAEAGGNLTRINSINFTVDDPTAYYNQAREKAMQDANAKAEQMATLAGITLGKPTYISESGGYIPTPYYLKDYAEGGSASTPISPGELDITLTVQVGYAIE